MTRPVAITGLLATAYLGLALLGTAWGTVAIPPIRTDFNRCIPEVRGS